VTTSGLPRTAWLAIVIAVTAFVLGFIGYVEHLPVPTAVYDTLGLFTLSFTVPPGAWVGGLPIVLEIARFLAPVVTVLAVGGIALRLFRDEADVVRARRARGHVVVCGLGQVGSIATQFLRERGHRVVAVERDALRPEILAARAHGIPVVIGDATSPRVQTRAGLVRASRLVWSGPEWALGQSVANSWKTRIANSRTAGSSSRTGLASVPACLVEVGDLALCNELRRQALEDDSATFREMLDVDYFNLAENAAQRLLWNVTRGYATVGAGDPFTLWILGGGSLAEALVVQAARNWWGARTRPDLSVHLFGRGAGELEDRISLTWPEVGTACRLVAHPGPEEAAAATRADTAQDDQPRGAFVLVDERDRAMQLAFRLHRETAIAAIAVAATGGGEERADDPRLLRFDPTSYGLESDVLLFDTYELLARMIHEQYTLARALNDDGSLDRTADRYATQREWSELEPRWQASNRDAARFVVSNLKQSGFEISRLTPPTSPTNPLLNPVDDVHVEKIAEREHDRWYRFMHANGYRQAPVRADSERGGTRPNLLPWSEASDEDRDYTRVQVRNYPRLLAQLGFHIQPRVGAAAS
jgi:hypothetical protein